MSGSDTLSLVLLSQIRFISINLSVTPPAGYSDGVSKGRIYIELLYAIFGEDVLICVDVDACMYKGQIQRLNFSKYIIA